MTELFELSLYEQVDRLVRGLGREQAIRVRTRGEVSQRCFLNRLAVVRRQREVRSDEEWVLHRTEAEMRARAGDEVRQVSGSMRLGDVDLNRRHSGYRAALGVHGNELPV